MPLASTGRLPSLACLVPTFLQLHTREHQKGRLPRAVTRDPSGHLICQCRPGIAVSVQAEKKKKKILLWESPLVPQGKKALYGRPSFLQAAGMVYFCQAVSWALCYRRREWAEGNRRKATNRGDRDTGEHVLRKAGEWGGWGGLGGWNNRCLIREAENG